MLIGACNPVPYASSEPGGVGRAHGTRRKTTTGGKATLTSLCAIFTFSALCPRTSSDHGVLYLK